MLNLMNFKKFYLLEYFNIPLKFFRIVELLNRAAEQIRKLGDIRDISSTVMTRKDWTDFEDYLKFLEHPLAFLDKSITTKFFEYVEELANREELVEV